MRIRRFGRVLRTVAVFEATKGILVLLVGGSLLSVLQNGVEGIAESIVAHFHLDPTSHYPHVFLNLASRVTDSNLWLWASLALAYSLLRFIEAYGLWRARAWAEWLAALSGGVYIPFALYELYQHPGWWTIGALTLNVMIVLFMVYGLRHRSEVAAEIKQADKPADSAENVS